METSKCVFPRKSARHQFYLATIKIHQTTKLYIPGPHKKRGKEFQPANQVFSRNSLCSLQHGQQLKLTSATKPSNNTPPPTRLPTPPRKGTGGNFKSTFSISGLRLHRIIQLTVTLSSLSQKRPASPSNGIFICTFCVIFYEDK